MSGTVEADVDADPDRKIDEGSDASPVSTKDSPPSGADVTVPPQDRRRKAEGSQGGATGSGSGTPVTRTTAQNPRAGTRSGDKDRGG